MNSLLKKIIHTHPGSLQIIIRILAGWVFLSEGIQKFLFPEQLGIGRFVKIGIPAPEFFAPFVGYVEIIAGIMLLIGLFTRIGALALIIDISVAIISTKIPMLIKSGFWAAAHESRVDISMLLSLVFILILGAGKYSLDYFMQKNSSTKESYSDRGIIKKLNKLSYNNEFPRFCPDACFKFIIIITGR